jgi:chromate transporter
LGRDHRRRPVRAALAFILIALSWIYIAFGDVPVVAGMLYGIKPAVTAIVAFAAYRIGSRALATAILWPSPRQHSSRSSLLNLPFPRS